VVAIAPAHIAALRSTSPPSWAQVGGLALWSYALDARSTGAHGDDVRRLTIEAGRAVAARVRAHPSRQPLTPNDYVWGSNGVAATYGVQLLVAHRFAADDELMDAALDSLHYLLGRNSFSLSWLTSVGANAVRHPHHRPSVADAPVDPWPGLLAGGPNQRRQDPVLEALPERPPGRMYADDHASFASNEYAINWNAPLVFLLAGAVDAELDRTRASR
jgi:endoglucanase